MTKATGVSVDDVAKRLIDYGFHAPTVSFPVAGTLMVEPTESEDLAELDRFCDAMMAIRAEIDAVADGAWPVENSPLRHAPHTAAALVAEWDTRTGGSWPCSPTGRWRKVLAAGGSYKPGLRRPESRLRVPSTGGLRQLTRSKSPRACMAGRGPGEADSERTQGVHRGLGAVSALRKMDRLPAGG